MKVIGLAVFIVLLMAGCAASSPVLDSDNANQDITPQEAASDIAVVSDDLIIWGGVIIGASNLQDVTQLEVLSYPLLKSHRPDTDRTPTGRFLIRHLGYLEVLDYAPGRLLTAVGKVAHVQSQPVGEVEYDFPVLEDEQIHLWKAQTSSSEPRINFGFGVILSN